MIFFKLFIPLLSAIVPAALATSAFSNMLLIILENTDFSSATADPNLQSFANSGVLFSNWVAIGHPSQPNYIAMTSGSANGVTSDSSVTLNVQNIVDLLEAKGLSWKSYQENWPGGCFTGTVSSDNLYFRLTRECILFCVSVFADPAISGSTTLSSAIRISKLTQHDAQRSSIRTSLVSIFHRERYQRLLGIL